MGFQAAVFIVSPSRRYRAPPTAIVWRVSEVLDFGYQYKDLERLTSVQESHISDRARSKERAGRVAYSTLYQRLTTIDRRNPKYHAPPFIVPPEEVRDYDLLMREDLIRAIPPDASRIEPIYAPWYAHEFHAHPWQMRDHNRTLEKIARGERTAPKDHGIINDYPLLWIPCRTLAKWMRDLWNHESARDQLRFDREAKARVLSWTATLEAYAAIHARGLFVY